MKAYSLFMCFASKEGILYKHFFAKNDFDTVPQQGIRASKLKEASFSTDEMYRNK